MKQIIDVEIGDVKASMEKVVLRSSPLGSCVAIVAYETKKRIGAMAHIMLPGKAPEGKPGTIKTKYAVNAIEMMIRNIEGMGGSVDDAVFVLLGGGNVLRRKDDTICKDNINSTLSIVEQRKLRLVAQSLGGIKRRIASLDIDRGVFYCIEGEGQEKEVYKV